MALVLERERARLSAYRPMDALGIPTLETERLRLRPFHTTDIDDYAALHADPEVLQHLGSGTEPWDRSRSWRHLAFIKLPVRGPKPAIPF